VFQWGSQMVPQVPKTFPIAPPFSFFPYVFQMCSHYVTFKVPICSRTCSPYHLTFIPYALAIIVLLFTSPIN
jgi:hypothetical protein